MGKSKELVSNHRKLLVYLSFFSINTLHTNFLISVNSVDNLDRHSFFYFSSNHRNNICRDTYLFFPKYVENDFILVLTYNYFVEIAYILYSVFIWTQEMVKLMRLSMILCGLIMSLSRTGLNLQFLCW